MTNRALLTQNGQFAKTVHTLAPGIWGFTGFAASNVYVVEGTNGLTVIDTTESVEAAEHILAALRQETDKPVGRIIYTHSHRDHISGAHVFAAGADIPILASAGFSSDLVDVDETVILAQQALGRRTQAQFGFGLTPDQRVSLGIGPGDRPLRGLGAGHLPPTQRITGDCDFDLDGVPARLIMAPGETADHMLVWLPGPRVLISGDNWYHAFPNLYAIRGTPYRDFAAWAASLTVMAKLTPDVLAPGHTLPVLGAEAIQNVLSTTREAIEFTMRKTAEMMDGGLSLNDIAATIELPAHLAGLPWLGEFYGKLGWSARAFATGTLGWYDGNPTHLGTLTDHARATQMAQLSGGVAALRSAAETAENLQWRLELCDHLLALGEPLEALKAETLEALAEDEINATARNTYLWEAKRLREGSL